MRRKTYVSVVLVVLIAVALLLPATKVEAAKKGTVTIDVKCPKKNEGKFSISVKPFELDVNVGDSIDWILDNDNKKNEYVEISAAKEDHWLFAEPSRKGNKKVEWTGILADAKDQTFEYKITVYCGELDGDTDPVVLDPRIKVGGG